MPFYYFHFSYVFHSIFFLFTFSFSLKKIFLNSTDFFLYSTEFQIIKVKYQLFVRNYSAFNEESLTIYNLHKSIEKPNFYYDFIQNKKFTFSLIKLNYSESNIIKSIYSNIESQENDQIFLDLNGNKIISNENEFNKSYIFSTPKKRSLNSHNNECMINTSLKGWKEKGYQDTIEHEGEVSKEYEKYQSNYKKKEIQNNMLLYQRNVNLKVNKLYSKSGQSLYTSFEISKDFNHMKTILGHMSLQNEMLQPIPIFCICSLEALDMVCTGDSCG